MIDVIETDSQFKSLETEWRILEKGTRVRVFQTFDWVYYGWSEFLCKKPGVKLWILKWHQDGRADRVIFPFYIDNRGTLRYILDDQCDTLDAVYVDGHNYHQAFKEAAELILKNNCIKCIWLQKMFGDGLALNHLGVQLRGGAIYRDQAFSWLEVKKSEDVVGSFCHMRSKDKADLRAIGRKANKYELRILSQENGNQFPSSEIIDLAKKMEIIIGREQGFVSNDLIRFIEKIYIVGKMEIVELLEGGELKALNFMLRHNNRYLSWIFLYTDPRTSTSMYVKYMMQMAKERDFVLDFGIGVYSYKIGTFRPNTSVTYSLRLGKHWWNHIPCLLAMNIRVAKDYLKPIFKSAH